MTAVAEKVAAPSITGKQEASASKERPVCRCCQPHDLEQLRRAGAQIGERVSIHPDVSIDNPEKLVLGDDVRIGPGVRLMCAGGIEIGARTILEPGVQALSTTTNIPISDNVKISEAGMRTAGVHICEDVLVGANAVLLPGFYVGLGAIVGPCTVVAYGINPNTLMNTVEPRKQNIPRKICK